MNKRRTAQLRHRIASTRRISMSAPVRLPARDNFRNGLSIRRSLARRAVGEGGFLNSWILFGLAVFFFGLLLSMLGAASQQPPMRTHTHNLDARVHPTGATPTPTATPC